MSVSVISVAPGCMTNGKAERTCQIKVPFGISFQQLVEVISSFGSHRNDGCLSVVVITIRVVGVSPIMLLSVAVKSYKRSYRNILCHIKFIIKMQSRYTTPDISI